LPHPPEHNFSIKQLAHKQTLAVKKEISQEAMAATQKLAMFLKTR